MASYFAIVAIRLTYVLLKNKIPHQSPVTPQLLRPEGCKLGIPKAFQVEIAKVAYLPPNRLQSSVAYTVPGGKRRWLCWFTEPITEPSNQNHVQKVSSFPNCQSWGGKKILQKFQELVVGLTTTLLKIMILVKVAHFPMY